MKQFILLLHETMGHDADMSPEEMQAVVQRYIDWSQDLRKRDIYVAGEQLDHDAGRIVRTANGQMIVSDGPYSETKDIVGGYFVIKAESMDAAVAIAQECPHALRGYPVEVREQPYAG